MRGARRPRRRGRRTGCVHRRTTTAQSRNTTPRRCAAATTSNSSRPTWSTSRLTSSSTAATGSSTSPRSRGSRQFRRELRPVHTRQHHRNAATLRGGVAGGGTGGLTGRRRCPSRMGFAPNSTGSWGSNKATPSIHRTRTGPLSRSGSKPGCPGAARYRVSGAGRGPPSTAYENTTLTSPVSPSGRRCFASVRAPVRSVRVRRPN